MEREIKFRAFHKKKKEFIHSNWKYGAVSFWEEIHFDFDSGYEQIQQYTGLKDKNGVEIYEGDIIRITHSEHTHWNYEKFRVYYCDDTGMFKITNDKSYPHDIVDSIGYKHIEVIGNMYQQSK